MGRNLAGVSRQRWRAIKSLVAALLSIGVGIGLLVAGPQGAQAARAAQATGATGASGIGDSYFPADGNGGYDALRYGIRVRYDLASGELVGRARVKVRATQRLSSLNLDLLLPASKVRVNGKAAAFSKPTRHELKVQLRPALQKGETARIAVSYAGRPATASYLGEANWLANSREMVAMNQPHMAPWWFPANDHPSDRAKIKVRIAVPRGQEAISNGLLRDKLRRGKRTVWVWGAEEPMVPYLAFIAVGDFSIKSGVTDGRSWTTAVSRQLPSARVSAGHAWLAKEGQVLSWLSDQVGSYPFTSSGGLVTSLDPGFALENQTRPTYPAWGINSNSLLVHELAHQWFGDSVSVRRWRDIWLNEGFATYFEARWKEDHGGPTTLSWLRQSYDSMQARASFWKVPVADPGPSRIFSEPVYYRGGMALAALRARVGDAAFDRTLRRWYAERRGGTGTTEQFIAIAEAESGLQLDAFFQQWLYDPTLPPRP